jgi:hypothetical protein
MARGREAAGYQAAGKGEKAHFGPAEGFGCGRRL